jgi:hypothetical protein
MEGLTKTEWNVTDNRFVAFLDILGFKDLVMRNSHKTIYELLLKISTIKNNIYDAQTKDVVKDNFKDAEVYIVNFSDSIAIFSKNDSEDNFAFFSFTIKFLFAESIKNNVPLKGTVAHGLISLNKTNQIYFGQPIIDAYLLQEEVNYMGIVAHNSIDNYIKEKKLNKRKTTSYIEISTPLKCGNINHLNLNYFEHFQKPNTANSKEQIIETIKSFRTHISGSPRKYIDNTITVIDNIYK